MDGGFSNFAMGTILGRVLLNHKSVDTEFIAQVPKAQVLWNVYTTVCAKPFPKIITFMISKIQDFEEFSRLDMQKYIVCTFLIQ